MFIFFIKKIKNLEKDLEAQNKLYLYRFNKVKEIIKIPDNYQKDMYLEKISNVKKIIELKKKRKRQNIL